MRYFALAIEKFHCFLIVNIEIKYMNSLYEFKKTPYIADGQETNACGRNIFIKKRKLLSLRQNQAQKGHSISATGVLVSGLKAQTQCTLILYL